jgi:hypothetical protein
VNNPNIIIRPAMTQAQKVVFFDEGETCGYKINGEVVLRLHYADMFRFSQMLRMHAKRAKSNAGDTSRHWGVMGILEDAEKVKRGIL